MARTKLSPEEVVRRDKARKCGIYRQLAVIWTKTDFERQRLNPEYTAPIRRKTVTQAAKPVMASKKAAHTAQIACNPPSPQSHLTPPLPPQP